MFINTAYMYVLGDLGHADIRTVINYIGQSYHGEAIVCYIGHLTKVRL